MAQIIVTFNEEELKRLTLVQLVKLCEYYGIELNKKDAKSKERCIQLITEIMPSPEPIYPNELSTMSVRVKRIYESMRSKENATD